MEMEILIPLLAIFFGGLTVLVPVIGITARIALKPLMEALSRYREMQGEAQTTRLMEQRLALLEEQFHSMERSLGHLVEEAEFRRQLESGAPRPGGGALPGS